MSTGGHTEGVCGVDIGGSGHRVAVRGLGRAGQATHRSPSGVRVQAGGLNLDEVLSTLPRTVARLRREAGVDRISACAVGVAGIMALLAPPDLPGRVGAACGCDVVLLASDAVTTLVGALGGRPGAVIAAGTGVVALGSDLAEVWNRVDGWGHLTGDRGGGAWIGIHALQAALRHIDGVDGPGGLQTGSAALAARARDRFGEPAALVRHLHTRDDRAGLLASFLPDVVAAAEDGDDVAHGILLAAGGELAATARAALAGVPARLAWAGGVLDHVLVVREAFLAGLPDGVATTAAAAGSLEGALTLAERAASGRAPAPRPPFLAVHTVGPA